MSVPINDRTLKAIQQDLKNRYATIIIDGILHSDSRERLREVLVSEHKLMLDTEEKVNYVLQETVGLGIIEDIIKNPDVTDITFNGTELIVDTNQEKYKVSNGVTEDYIVKIIQKFGAAVGKELTPKTPILDAVLGNLRINAMHKEIAPYGTTMALRAVRPRLALTEDNFNGFAPAFILEFLKVVIETQSNIVISGETGTGKTELQKLLISMIPFEQKICLIEDVLESHVKDLFPEKDVHSWITGGATSISDLIKAALRNNPRWIIISETRGEEAYEMIQAVLSGHHIITTLHAVNARAIPTRLVNMAKLGFPVDETSFKIDINKYFDFGLHIKRETVNGRVIRYLSEIIEFQESGEHITVFKQRITREGMRSYVGNYSSEFADKLEEIRSNYSGLPRSME